MYTLAAAGGPPGVLCVRPKGGSGIRRSDSRGGRTAKTHALTDERCRPVAVLLTGGQVAAFSAAEALPEAMADCRKLDGDKGDDTNRIRKTVEAGGALAQQSTASRQAPSASPIGHTAPTRSARTRPDASHGSTSPPRVICKNTFAFSGLLERERQLVERFFIRVKSFRGIATRSDRRPDNVLAAIALAAIRLWIAAMCVRGLRHPFGAAVPVAWHAVPERYGPRTTLYNPSSDGGRRGSRTASWLRCQKPTTGTSS